MSDPLSFFAANSDSDDTDSSDEDGSTADTKPAVKSVEKTENKVLPPPIDALSDPKKLEFVMDESQRSVDWEMLTKKAPVVPEKEYKPWEERLPSVEQSVKTKAGKKEKTLAQQVPGASAPNKAEGTLEGRTQEYIDNAMHWSKMYQTMDASGNVKRVRPEEIGGEKGLLFTDLDAQKVAYGGVKRKGNDQHYRTKEAKKRTLGQSNREKMFVEEEKRQLRQNFDSDY